MGDVIGFPTAASAWQGRLAAYHAFGEPTAGVTELQPIGIYSIPGCHAWAPPKVELTGNAIPVRGRVSRYRELARADRRRLLRHAEAAGVTETSVCWAFTSSAPTPPRWCTSDNSDGLRRNSRISRRRGVQLPTFSEAYKVAALDVMNKMRALSQFPTEPNPRLTTGSGTRTNGARCKTRASSVRTAPSENTGFREEDTMADDDRRNQQPGQTRLYELEFPTPTLDVRRPRTGHGARVEGFSRRRTRDSPGRPASANTLDTELVASFAIDDLLNYRSRRPAMTFKTDRFTHYEEPQLNLYALPRRGEHRSCS